MSAVLSSPCFTLSWRHLLVYSSCLFFLRSESTICTFGTRPTQFSRPKNKWKTARRITTSLTCHGDSLVALFPKRTETIWENCGKETSFLLTCVWCILPVSYTNCPAACERNVPYLFHANTVFLHIWTPVFMHLLRCVFLNDAAPISTSANCPW